MGAEGSRNASKEVDISRKRPLTPASTMPVPTSSPMVKAESNANQEVVAVAEADGSRSEEMEMATASNVSDDDDDENWPPLQLQPAPVQIKQEEVCGNFVAPWWHQLQELERSTRYFEMWKHGKLLDIKFEVGPDKDIIWAHKLVLSVRSEDKQLLDQLKEGVIKCPTLDATAFKQTIEFLYTGQIELTNLALVEKILEVARFLGIPDLKGKCIDGLRAIVNTETALDLFCKALISQNEGIKDLTASFITRNIQEIFTSTAFLQLAGENLLRFLQSDDWFIEDETEVLEAVMRWAEHKLSSFRQPHDGLKRGIIGPAFYHIRFTSLSPQTFLKVEAAHKDLFDKDEVIEFFRYTTSKSLNSQDTCAPPKNFNANQRKKKDVMNWQLDVSVNSTCEVSAPAPSCSTTPKKEYKASPPKIPRFDTNLMNEDVPHRSPSESLPQFNLQNQNNDKIICLHKYVQGLVEEADKAGLTKVDQIVKLTRIPETRVYLPNLTEFNLDIMLNNRSEFESGSKFKHSMKNLQESLSEILFFDVAQSHSMTHNGVPSTNTLSELLSSKVNVKLTCEKTLLLKINHNEGLILINCLKNAQAIIDGASEFPLKTLAVSECDLLGSLDPLKTDQLEVIIMRRVRNLKNNTNFLSKCRLLRTFCWNGPGLEEVNLTETLLSRNPHLKILGGARCKLSVAAGTGDGYCNYLRELYLDNCTIPSLVIPKLPELFPFVQKVQLDGPDNDSSLLHSLLKIESLEWLFMWEMCYCRTRGKKKVLSEESKFVQEFLSKVFDPKFAKKQTMTFILEKKKLVNDCTPSTSSSALSQQQALNNMDPTSWKGDKVESKKFDHVCRWDYRHFLFDTFFDSYEAYKFFESTDSDVKKKKKNAPLVSNDATPEKVVQSVSNSNEQMVEV